MAGREEPGQPAGADGSGEPAVRTVKLPADRARRGDTTYLFTGVPVDRLRLPLLRRGRRWWRHAATVAALAATALAALALALRYWQSPG